MEVVTGSMNDGVPGGGKKGDKEQNPEQEEDSKPPAIDTSVADTITSPSAGAMASSSQSTGTEDASSRALLSNSLIRMTDGLPRRELKLIIAEAEECEKALQGEIDMLNRALEVERRKTKNNKKKATTESNSSSTTGGNDKQEGTNADEGVVMDDKTEAAVNTMINSEITPPDQFWTLSALLGRLRHDLTTPLPPQSQIPLTREQNGLGPLEAQLARKIPPYLKKKRGSLLNQQTTFVPSTGTASAGGSRSGTTTPSGSGRSTPVSGAVGGGGNNSTASSTVEISQFQRLLDIDDHPVYTREHNNPDQLMSLWKKISMHKSSLVFRKPVNPKEAPGYTDRIMFPMDLSVMRKLILARTVKSYKDFSQRVALISHNCVKYNGRESDYALVAREFESVCSEFIWIAVQDEIAEGATAAGVSSAAISAPVAAAASATLATKLATAETSASMEKKDSTSQKSPSQFSVTAAATTATAGGESSEKDTTASTANGTDNTDKKRKHDEVAAVGTTDDDQEKEPPAKEAKKNSG